MKLTDLDPRWIGLNTIAANYGSAHLGLSFDCPCCLNTERSTRLALFFDPPIDPQGLLTNTTYVAKKQAKHVWGRAGETFANLTLTPSVDASEHGHWHGFITGGEIK